MRGEIEVKAGNGDAAFAAFARVLARPPASLDARACGAVIAAATVAQRWDVLLGAYDRLVTLEPGAASDGNLRTLEALAHLGLGELERALAASDAASPTNPELVALHDVMRGQALRQQRHFDDVWPRRRPP